MGGHSRGSVYRGGKEMALLIVQAEIGDFPKLGTLFWGSP